MAATSGDRRKLRVLMVYDRLDVPSTTVRALQFADLFGRSDRFDVEFVGRQSESFHRISRHFPRRAGLHVPIGLIDRNIQRRRDDAIVAKSRHVDLVMMMTVPSWSLHHRIRELPGVRVITDLIDALWLPCFRDLGWEHIDEMLQTSDSVICENEYTANYTAKLNSSVFVVPDAPQIEVFDQYRSSVTRDPSRVTVGWIGGKYTADALYQIYEALEITFAKHNGLHLRLVGADPDRLPRFAHTQYSVVPRYDQRLMVKEVLAMDIGIFPMFDIDESRYRGTLKTRVYMSGEAAVIGQELGENQTLIRHGFNGLLASGTEAWCESLDQLITDGPARKQMAAAGLGTIRNGYTVQHCFDRLTTAMHRTMDRPNQSH